MKQTSRAVRIPSLRKKKEQGEKITMLTASNSWMARMLAETGDVDILLVGDSLGMVELGYDSTIPVTLDDMVRHTRAVRNGAPNALVVADLPFLTYTSDTDALRSAARLMQEGGANAVKLEGGAPLVQTVRRLVDAGVPVMGHLGLLPQSVHQLGGYRQQATAPEEQEALVADALALEAAGAFSIVVECIPQEAARLVTETCKIPTIGIGAGPFCDGQGLVTHDMLGLSGSSPPSFAKRFAELEATISEATRAFAQEVRGGEFPKAAGAAK